MKRGSPSSGAIGTRAGPRVRALLGAVALLGLAATSVFAQSDGAPRLVVPETISAGAGQAPLRISITPAAAVPKNAFVRIRGLPPMAALSDGHAIAPGAWAVSVSGLADLRVTIPATAQGRSPLTVTLISVDGTIIAEAQTALVIGAAAPPPAPAATAAPSAAQAPEARSAVVLLKPEDRDRALRLVKRGQQLLEDSNIAEARLLFEKAADLGFADGAIALGATFDETELTKAGVRGVKGDAKEARRWYERAAQLGAREAQQRLQRLGAR
jgi:hypothetical protein